MPQSEGGVLRRLLRWLARLFKRSTTSHLFPVNPDPARKRLVVLVHGFGSSKVCWKQLLTLFRDDPKISEAFDFACFEYPTGWITWSFLRRIPGLLEIAQGLNSFLELSELAAYREIVLVGHSQGGLVIQNALVDKLRWEKVEDLYRVRQVILIATPNLGSALLSLTRKFLSVFVPNSQEHSLRVFDSQITELRAVITARIVGTHGQSAAWPIPVQCFWGTVDGIVAEASARGPFDADLATSLNGDHFSILRPVSREHEGYKLIAEALLEPSGHREVFEIDLFEIKITVAPVVGNRDFQFMHGSRTVKVHTDNIAKVDRTMKFSTKNRCNDMFALRYTTMDDGYVKGTMSHANEAPPSETAESEARNSTVTFGFRPKHGETYRLLVEVYKGFDKGNRNAHFHLVPYGRKAYYKRIVVTVDLSAYLDAGLPITELPKLYYFDRDHGHAELCDKRLLNDPRQALAGKKSGVWQWEIQSVREGIVDLVWDVAEIDAILVPATAAQP